MLQLRCTEGLVRVLVVSAMLAVTPVGIACAQTVPASQEQPEPTDGVGSREFWVGADVSKDNWLIYTGGTYAPWGDIHRDGFRLRSTTGYGQYSYHWNAATKVAVDKSYADVLIGYQQQFGELTAKAFIGGAMLNRTFDLSSHASIRGFAHTDGTVIDIGVKGAVELWLNVGERSFASLDVAYADTRSTLSVRSRAGYRVLPTVSAGLEATLNREDTAGEVQIDKTTTPIGNSRIGAFARYEWFGGEISASGGLSGEWLERTSGGSMEVMRRPSPYGTLNFIVQY